MLEHAKQLSQKYPEKTQFRLNEIQIEAVIKINNPNYTISQKNVIFLKNYLLSINIFGYYEFWLFSYCTVLFDDKTIKDIINNIIHQKQDILDFPQLRQVKYDAILNCVDLFLKRNALEMLPELFNYLQKSLDSHLLLYEKASLVYMKAVYDLKVDFTNAKAKENLSSCVSTFELLECFELVNSIKKEVNDYFPNYHI